VYDAVLYRTGMQLRSQRETKNAIRQSGDGQLLALVDSLSRLQEDIARINITDYNNQQQEFKRQQKLKFQISNLEQTIIELSEPYRKQHAVNATWQMVRDRLKENEAAVEFVFSANDIMALVVRKGYDAPKAVLLTCGDTLISHLKALGVKRTDKMAVKLYNNHAIDLYGMLWKPLETYLNGVETVYYSTPGILNNLSFAAFATPDGGYLFDKYDLCQLTTTAALLRPHSEERPKSAMLMGGIYYSEKQRGLVESGNYNAFRGINDDDDGDRSFADFEEKTTNEEERGGLKEHFGYLRYSANELQSIEKDLKDSGIGASNIKVSKETSATEQTFRDIAASQPSVVHLATHGFFIANSDDAYKVPFYKNHSQYIDNSMRRAGVALSGAEQTWCGNEEAENNDGILTADEVSQLNLQKTQLVTLSACETALGDYSFEGIYGLPRGFKQAGVRSLLVSLWSVNDKSTSLLMSEFYGRWLGGTPMRTALHEAIKTVRQSYPQPYYWAPFILLDAN